MNGEGLVKMECVRVTCPACGQEVEAIARDGVIRGWCSISRQRVNFPIEMGKNPTAETSPVKDVVGAYEAGVKTVVIQSRYKIPPGRMYRILHSANVRLRKDRKPKRGRGLISSHQ